ncbi:MAG: FAD-dependent oxidoreductase [Bacteroidia bacterium]
MGSQQNAGIEIHGHRGARGYYPENTITSFIEAIKLGVTAIELDVVISKDMQVVVSHEAWMNELFCSTPDGIAVKSDAKEKFNLFKMDYAEIAKFDCGSRGNSEFPLQKKIAEHKPLLGEVISKVQAFTSQNKLPPVKYNIEIKTEEQEPDGAFNPDPATFAELVCKEVEKYRIKEHCNLQSFDVRILKEIKKCWPEIELAFLVENKDSFETNMQRLGFIPDTYSPEFILIDENLVKKISAMGMRLIPWTVNETSDIKKMIASGVDGIISDYPDRVIDVLNAHTNSFSARSRNNIIEQLKSSQFDLLVIGGGITGAGIALDASARGLKVALIEMQDFASGTSGRSTKLIHGGLRYLKQMEFKLVAEVGKEREIIHRIAPHLTKPEPMLLPIVRGGSLGKVSARFGMSVYEWLAGVKHEEKHRSLNFEETGNAEPLLRKDNLLGGILFYEYRTDDARLTIEVMKEAVNRGALAINYVKATGFIYNGNKITGAKTENIFNGDKFEIKAKYIVNAAGPWVDDIDDLEINKTPHKLQITKGVHLVVDHKKLPVKQSAYFDTFDKRMIFVIPRDGKTYIGTTDTFYKGGLVDPEITEEDKTYLIKCVNDYFPECKLMLGDIESGWAGLRPLINKPGKGASEISRKDEMFISDSGLIIIAGGKLTGYRKMAQRIVDVVARKMRAAGRNVPGCSTDKIPVSGGNIAENFSAFVKRKVAEGISTGLTEKEAVMLVNKYGSNVDELFKLYSGATEERLPRVLQAQLKYAVENEMCVTSEDFFIRRTGMQYFDIENVAKYRNGISEQMQKLIKKIN